MSLNLAEIPTTGTKKDFGRLEDGPHLARVVSVIDYGLQPQTDWKTKEPTDPKSIVAITFETPNEMITYTKDDVEVTRPRWISKEYQLSLNEKANLTKLIASLKPSLKSLDELLNTPCMITVGSTSGGKAKITAVSLPMKGTVVPDLQNDSFMFDFSAPNKTDWDSLLEWQQNKVKEALDFDGSAVDTMLNAPTEDEF